MESKQLGNTDSCLDVHIVASDFVHAEGGRGRAARLAGGGGQGRGVAQLAGEGAVRGRWRAAGPPSSSARMAEARGGTAFPAG